MKIIIAMIFSWPIFISSGQVPLKNHYDNLYPNYFSSIQISNDPQNCYNIGNINSWNLIGLLNMFETNKDKAYLVKFINLVLIIQKNRHDTRGTGSEPLWVNKNDDLCDLVDHDPDSEPLYFNSMLLFSMAKYVYIVHKEPSLSLYSSPLPSGQNNSVTLISQNLLDQFQVNPSIITFGDFAKWLGKRVEQSILFILNNYWDDNFGIKGHIREECNEGGKRTCGTAMNFNSPFAAALLLMGETNSDFGHGNLRSIHLAKSQIIAGLHKSSINLIDGCNCNLSGCATYNHPVLRLMNNNNNSYFWFHSGWGIVKENCVLHPFNPQPKISNYTEFVEDVSHGAMDLWFVRACYEAQLAPCNNCTPYFTLTEMERFRNTLTKNIYYTDNTGGHFHNAVNGANNQIANSNCTQNCPPDLFWGEVLDWMPLYKFDNSSSPKVYDILMNHTIGLIQNPTTRFLSGAQSYLGFSEVVKAQWDKECVDLSMRNRKLVYDQDFTIKGRLVIDPSVPNTLLNSTASFADPIINTPDFTIEPGVTCNMKAGGGIILKPGFKAKQGSQFKARHVPSNCSSENELRIYPDVPGNPVLENSPTKDLFSISVNPNPGSGIFLVSTNQTSAENKTISFELFNSGGLRVFLFTAQEGQTMEINLSEFSTGLYFLSGVSSSGERASCKILIQK